MCDTSRIYVRSCNGGGRGRKARAVKEQCLLEVLKPEQTAVEFNNETCVSAIVLIEHTPNVLFVSSEVEERWLGFAPHQATFSVALGPFRNSKSLFEARVTFVAWEVEKKHNIRNEDDSKRHSFGRQDNSISVRLGDLNAAQFEHKLLRPSLSPSDAISSASTKAAVMDQTPRLRSAYPTSPQTNRRPPRFNISSSDGKRTSQPLPNIPALKASAQPPNDPLIPEHILDAPTQRLFALSFAVLLWTWRFYDWSMLNESEEQSLCLFMKWVAIDGVFLFGLPGLRIPWLEWSASTMMLLFCSHALLDGMLMFRIPLPITPAFAALGRSVWGAYELAVNEHNVNPDTVKFNDSLILGRQIIHILPEGSAILNPDKQVFCIDGTRTEARLPIKINSTNPISMHLLRTDLDTEANETIHIGKSQIRTMHKDASRLISYSEKEFEPKTLYFPVKKSGLYVLSKVVDESNLEVARKQLAHTVVVPCPKAEMKPSSRDQCRGELSSVEIDVTGTPPLTLKYRKKVANRTAQDATFENILPEDFNSPLARQDQSALIIPNKIDTAWARTQKISVPLTESLGTSGRWAYSIEEVRDAFGNSVVYSTKDHEDQERHLIRSSHLHQVIEVHERPTVTLHGCSPQNPMKVATGQKANLPVRLGSTGRGELGEKYDLEYLFSPQSDISATGDHMLAAKPKTFKGVTSKSQPQIEDPGLYTITGVSTKFCKGEVLEPASCNLQNPPQPKLAIQSEEIFDKCAGSPIGLRVDLDIIGTPPFALTYRMTRLGSKMEIDETVTVDGLRGQIELTPKQAGNYKYEFTEISDAVYRGQKLDKIALDQVVKPSASANIVKAGERKVACIDDAVSFDVALQGEGPFSIEYELIHNGRRAKHTLENIEQSKIEITTTPLTDGGDYTLALASVTDRMGCKEFLKDEARISVRHQRPRVGFRPVDGHRSVSALEGRKVQLPLRLEGDGPWKVKYVNKSGHEQSVNVLQQNDRITVDKEGRYELTDVKDGTCPGTVDEAAKDFEVKWIPRPELRVAPSDIVERKGSTLIRADVCEGDEDAVEVLFKGSPPYLVDYQLHVQPTKGSMSPKDKELRAALNVASLRMDTKLAGVYEYRFTKLQDANYEHSSKHFNPLTVQQRVNPRPSVAFTNAEKTYRYCSTESDGEEVIPITLHGVPPFDVEIEIKHQGTARPETVSLTGITGTSHNIRIPHNRLQRGKSSVSLRRASDSRGCVRALDSTTPRVQISVHDAPTIRPLEAQTDFCVGDRLNFALSGVAPFNVFYNFEGAAKKAVATSSTFRRLAEKPGTFVITGVQDDASQCKAATNITKHIHGLPWVRVSKGRDAYVDIHEGGEAEILFEFGGVPPFEFTYTRSSNTDKHGKKAGRILDMHSERSESHSMRIRAHEEGTYEVVSIKDRYCSYTKPGVKVDQKEAQKRLMY